jgi:hypothetical protein
LWVLVEHPLLVQEPAVFPVVLRNMEWFMLAAVAVEAIIMLLVELVLVQ